MGRVDFLNLLIDFTVVADAFLDLLQLTWSASLLSVEMLHVAQLSLSTLFGVKIVRGYAQRRFLEDNQLRNRCVASLQ